MNDNLKESVIARTIAMCQIDPELSPEDVMRRILKQHNDKVAEYKSLELIYDEIIKEYNGI